MTDTVNVSREARYGDETASQIVRRWAAWIIDVSADMEQPEWGGKTDNDVKNERDFLIRSLLAAAPKAEPVVSCKNCGTVRGATNECDCSRHDGSVPEWEAVHPEAPKVEQEPAAWQVWLTNSEGEGHWSDISKDDRQKLEYFRSTGREMRPLFPPIPASDELLGALEAICDMQARNYGDGAATHIALCNLSQNARRIIAKHKGPQS